MQNLENYWEPRLIERLKLSFTAGTPQASTPTDITDPAHDFAHFTRVVKTAKSLCEIEGADPWIVVPAAWLHDWVNLPKNHPERKSASRLSAQAASEWLMSVGFPKEKLDPVYHAIHAHSYSAQIEPATLEAKIVQDADRLDGLGAIGIARCFTVGGILKRNLYETFDPFCENRVPNDGIYTVDHFYEKLFKTAKTLHTPAGREEGERRVLAMKRFLADLKEEIT